MSLYIAELKSLNTITSTTVYGTEVFSLVVQYEIKEVQ